MRICRVCGTLYSPKEGPCPKCAAGAILESDPNAHAVDEGMDGEKLKRARRRSWVEIAVGIPALIGFIYLIMWLTRLVRM